MPEINCGFDNPADLQQYGPTLTVMVGFDPEFVNGIKGRPDLPGDSVHALVDTGASESCIDTDLATQLNLPVVDTRSISGVGGKFEAPVYMAQVYIPTLDSTIYGRFTGVHLRAGGQPHSVLVGRLFLMHHTMIYNGSSGAVMLSRP